MIVRPSIVRPCLVSFLVALSCALLPATGVRAQAHGQVTLPDHVHATQMYPFDPPTAALGPQTLTPPYGLQIVNAETVVHTSTFHADAPTVALSPSIVFNFPITPDIGAYLNGGLHYAYKTIGWVGHIYTEACLTDAEAPLWPQRTPKGADSSTCPSRADTDTQTFIPRQWYQVGDTRADLYVVQNQGFIYIPTATPVSVQQVTVPVRFHTSGYTYYYSGNHSGPNDLAAACSGAACGPRLSDVHTPPFDLVVAPAALMQIKVLPETIVYLPPGDKSTGIFKLTRTFGTTITAGETIGIDNSSVQDDWTELVSTGGFTGDVGKVLQLGFNGTSDTRWDDKTTLKAGQSLERNLQGTHQVATAFTRTIAADHGTVPGAGGAFDKQPFWGDQVVVLVHPQVAVWDFYGRPVMQQFAASSAGGLPNDIAITIGELDACANGAAPYANGYTFTTATQQQETLTADECRSLAALDPFWGKGQSADLSARGQLLVASQEYGIPVVGPQTENSLDIQTITSDSETVTNTHTSTYASTVESILATTSSVGVTFGLNTGSVFGPFNFGLSDSVTLKSGESLDKSITMNLTYKNSSATTFRNDVQTEGKIDDDANRGYAPHVEVYQDDTFGSLMFRDPDATCSPLPDCRAVAPLGPSTQVPRRKKPPIVHPPIPVHAPMHAPLHS